MDLLFLARRERNRAVPFCFRLASQTAGTLLANFWVKWTPPPKKKKTAKSQSDPKISRAATEWLRTASLGSARSFRAASAEALRSDPRSSCRRSCSAPMAPETAMFFGRSVKELGV